MSPELFAMQLAAGAWGLSAATAHHVRVYRRLGIGRIFLANQLVGRADLDFVLGEIAGDPDFDFYCLVDSADGAALLAAAAARAGCVRPIQVLIETGALGGRAGVRDSGAALALARLIAGTPELALRGVETFEGIRQTSPDAKGGAADMIELATAAAREIALEGLFADGPVLLSASGSAFLDLCATMLPAELGDRATERVIRPGCYVTHDHGLYAGLAVGQGMPRLRAALEIWATVLSVPEPGLAILGAGKRDVSHDAGPPVPLWRHRPGTGRNPAPATGLETIDLWDQHLALADPGATLAVGDLVGLGISHPCATFDRWTALWTVDEDYRVTGAITTIF